MPDQRLKVPEIEAWLERAKVAIEAKRPTMWLKWINGPKRYRVYLERKRDEPVRVRGRSRNNPDKDTIMFINLNGDILKASGWESPAAGVRSHIKLVNPESLDGSTAWLYRRGGPNDV